MKGFEITINDEQQTVAVNKGTVIISISCKFGLSITGADDEEGVSLRWNSSTVNMGDKINITPIDTDFTDPPLEKTLTNSKDLLDVYYNLKEILTKQGFIK